MRNLECFAFCLVVVKMWERQGKLWGFVLVFFFFFLILPGYIWQNYTRFTQFSTFCEVSINLIILEWSVIS